MVLMVEWADMTQNNKPNRMTVFIQNNKNLLIALVAIVVVVLLAIMIPRMTRDGAPETAPVTTEEVTTEETAPVSTTPTGEAAYKSAIADHEGRLITVMDGCVAEPKTQEVALGEHALLVNASNTPHTFTVGSETYTVGERHYKTLRLATAGEYSVSCDDIKDIATITVK